MCQGYLFHKWSKWQQFQEEGIDHGWVWKPVNPGIPYRKNKQRRVCERCGKVQEETID